MTKRATAALVNLEEVANELAKVDEARDGLVQRRNRLITRAWTSGAPVSRIAVAAQMRRESLYVLRQMGKVRSQ